MFASVAGILVFTSDVQHGTLEPTLIARPSRTTLAAANGAIALIFGAAIATVGQLSGWLGGVAARADLGDHSLIVERAMSATGFVALASVLGLGVGMIARHSAAVISGRLVWWLVVEILIVALAPARIARFLAFVAAGVCVAVAGVQIALAAGATPSAAARAVPADRTASGWVATALTTMLRPGRRGGGG